MRRRAMSSTGQHSAEFALLIGLAGLAAVSMQLALRQSVQRGVQAASDLVFGPETDARRVERDEDAETVTVDTLASQTIREEGEADFRRTVTIDGSSGGTSINTLTQLRVLAESP